MFGCDILLIDHQVIFDRQTQCGMQYSAVFSGIDVLAAKHVCAACFNPCLLSEFYQRCNHFGVNKILGKVHMQPRSIEG